MKDRQVEHSGNVSRIPFVSSFLHCIAMTTIVFFRSNFGYTFLRPKSVFFAFSWASMLFFIYSLYEPGAWPKYRYVCTFGAAAVALYWLHFGRAVYQQFRRSAPHDQHSGTSHLHWLLGFVGVQKQPRIEKAFQLWVEPTVTLAVAAVLRIAVGETRLSLWLLCAAFALWLKELVNSWLQLRQRKRQQDTFEDAGETVGTDSRESESELKATRKTKIRRARGGSTP